MLGARSASAVALIVMTADIVYNVDFARVNSQWLNNQHNAETVSTHQAGERLANHGPFDHSEGS